MNMLLKLFFHVLIIYLMGLYTAGETYPIWQALLVGLLLVPIGYIGDLYVMPRVGNFQSAVIEGTIVFSIILLLQFIFPVQDISIIWASSSGFFVMIFEVILHRRLIDHHLYSRTS